MRSITRSVVVSFVVVSLHHLFMSYDRGRRAVIMVHDRVHAFVFHGSVPFIGRALWSMVIVVVMIDGCMCVILPSIDLMSV